MYNMRVLNNPYNNKNRNVMNSVHGVQLPEIQDRKLELVSHGRYFLLNRIRGIKLLKKKETS